MAASLRGAFSRIDLQVSRFCFPLCISEGGKYWGLEGRTGWPKAGWGRLALWPDGPPGWPGPAEGPPAYSSFTHLKMSLQIPPHNAMTHVDKASAFHNLTFVAVPSRRMLGIDTICIC